MKKIILLCAMLLVWSASAFAAQQKSDYTSPNFNAANIHNIVIMSQVPNESLPYVVDGNIVMTLPEALKKELKLPVNIKADTMMEVVVKVQKLTGKNIMAMMQTQDVNQQQEAINLVWDYIGKNYDTIINIGVLQAGYTQKYSNGFSYMTTENQTSTRSNGYGQVATMNTPVQRENVVGRGMVDVAQITLNITVQNSNEFVVTRREFRNKISSGMAATTPEDIGKRIVGSFAHDFSKKFNKN